MPIRAGELGLETPDRRRMTGLPVHRRDFAGAVIAQNVKSLSLAGAGRRLRSFRSCGGNAPGLS
jgi:hypothetical protein